MAGLLELNVGFASGKGAQSENGQYGRSNKFLPNLNVYWFFGCKYTIILLDAFFLLPLLTIQ